MNREEERLKTFTTIGWSSAYRDINWLAKTGFYATGFGDMAKCFFCKTAISKWKHVENIVDTHLKYSPNCPLLIDVRRTNNIALGTIEELEELLPPRSYDVCGNFDNVPSNNSREREFKMNTPPVQCPDFKEVNARLASFKEWPIALKQRPKDLVYAGFYYLGMGDRVRCYSCGGGLRNWNETDDPLSEHMKYYPDCEFIKYMRNEAGPSSELKTIVDNSVINELNILDKPTTQSDNCSEYFRNLELATTSTSGTDMNIKQRSKYQTDDEKSLCVLCSNDKFDTAFYPCGHVLACKLCAISVTNCPMCRTTIDGILKIYFP